MPYQSDERGLPLYDYLQRRTDKSRDNIFYKVPAFGNELHLNLTLNRKLMSPNLVVETRLADGTVSNTPVPQNTYYLGHVMYDPRSMVAVSDEGGLVCIYHIRLHSSNTKPVNTAVAKLYRTSDKLKRSIFLALIQVQYVYSTHYSFLVIDMFLLVLVSRSKSSL